MPRHADRGLCCGAGGARMWMEEHIGKRVNHERVEEALDTGASKIATGCPFCRVMMTDGVDDVAAASDLPKAEVLDVAQLLLGSLDTSSVTLPEKGTAAREFEERAPRVEASTATVEAEPEAEPESTPQASTATETKPVTGLGIAGGAKRPGAKKAEPAAAAAPAPAEPTTPEPEVKGLGIASGARRPGAKKAAPAAPAAAAQAEPQAEPAAPAEPAKPEPEVKGLGIAAGARRPGAKKAPAASKPVAPQPEPASAGESGAAPEPSAEGDGETPAPPVKGLGIAKGARPPGKR
jgi:hypothetical protein